MKKLLSILSMVAFVALVTTACAERLTPSKHYLTKRLSLERFDGISTSTSIDVIYSQTSGGQTVEVYAPDNVMEYVDVRVEGGTLKVGYKKTKGQLSFNGNYKVEVRVSAPAVRSLRTSSSGDILLKNGLKTSENVTIQASSSGDIKGGRVSCGDVSIASSSSGDIHLEGLTCSNLEVRASSSGDITLKNINAKNVNGSSSSAGDVYLQGTCQTASYSASSSGDLKASDLKAKDVVAKASSAGDISCYASHSLKASTSSAGDIAYKGNPQYVDYSPKRGLRKLD